MSKLDFDHKNKPHQVLCSSWNEPAYFDDEKMARAAYDMYSSAARGKSYTWSLIINGNKVASKDSPVKGSRVV